MVQYTYDEAGNLISIVYPGNKIVSYTYDEANQLVQVEDWQQHQTHYEYDSQGLLVKITRPDGSVETRSYDAVGQLTGLQDLAADGTVIQRNTLSYDANGNLSEQQSDIEQQMFPVAQDTMTYGADNRLATFNGNETSFDANGNLLHGPLQGSIQAFEYDARNQLIAAGGFSYDYDAEGNRISRRYAGVETRFVVDSLLSNVIMETNSSNQPQTYYVYGLELISQLGADGSYKLYHFNSNGNTMALSNIEGAVTDRYAYDSFGELTLRQGDTTNPFLFDGRDGIMTDDNGLLYMRARYYNPEIKRFMNEDTYQGEIQDPLTLNQYSYVENNPLIKVDPSGHCGFSSRDQKTDCIIDFIPVVGSAKAASEVITGRNPITKEELSPGDRAISAVGLLPEGKVIAKGAKLLGKSVSKGFKAVKKLLEACNCFAAGTKVLTDEGEKNIEDIEVGDKVLSKDEATGEVGYKEVTATFNHETDEIYKIHVGGLTIESTFNHPFYVEGKGWTFVKDLKVGDLLVQSDGNTLKIESIELLHKHVTVYNMTVDEFHTYFVSDLGIWVHNTSCFNWSAIKGTQPVIDGTNIPRSFVINGLKVNGKEVWVGGNATKHMGEFVTSANKAGGGLLSENEIMESFMNAAKLAAKQELKHGDNRLFVGGWEIGINGETGVIYHALMK
uniref:Hint domain-containing protein n=1 Tax=Paenibacillus athensensis TaxID=1967502 RepID=A0A4Y8PXR6_9BACL